MFKTLVAAAALAQVSSTVIVDADHKTRAITPAMVDEINVSSTSVKSSQRTYFIIVHVI
jgi:hypothetical protein